MGRDKVGDVVEIHDVVKKALAETFTYAMENPARFRSYLDKLNYCLNWGKTERDYPTYVKIYPDHMPHSFLFIITTYRVSNDTWNYVEAAPFTLALIYDQNRDGWGCHS